MSQISHANNVTILQTRTFQIRTESSPVTIGETSPGKNVDINNLQNVDQENHHALKFKQQITFRAINKGYAKNLNLVKPEDSPLESKSSIQKKTIPKVEKSDFDAADISGEFSTRIRARRWGTFASVPIQVPRPREQRTDSNHNCSCNSRHSSSRISE